MTDILKRSIVLILMFIIAFSVSAESYAVQDVQVQFESINAVEPRVTGLINTYSFSANKSGSNLIVYATVNCVTSVVKCGIKEMVIQRRVSTDYAWSDYLTYEDIYDEQSAFGMTKYIAVTTGYQYRVVATLYAKKSLFSTEKVEVTSNIVWI